MRTTVNLSARTLSAARSLARQEGVSLGSAIDLLVQRGLTGKGDATTGEDGIPRFVVRETAPTFGTKEVAAAINDE